jgi:hypothetical protein
VEFGRKSKKQRYQYGVNVSWASGLLKSSEMVGFDSCCWPMGADNSKGSTSTMICPSCMLSWKYHIFLLMICFNIGTDEAIDTVISMLKSHDFGQNAEEIHRDCLSCKQAQ